MENKAKVPNLKQPNKLSTAKLILSAYTSKQTQIKSIKMHVYFNGQQSNRCVTGIRIENGEHWDGKGCKVVGNEHKTKYLQQLKSQLDDIYYNLQHRGRSMTAKMLLECLTKKRSWINEVPNLTDTLLHYNESRREEMKAGKIDKRTFSRFGKWRLIIIDFCKYQYKTDNLPLDDLKPILGKQIDSYLRANCKYSDVYTAKVCRYLKTCLSYAMANEWTNRNVLSLCRWSAEPKDIKALTDEEFKAIESLKILDSELERVRLLFVFCGYTAFGHKDLAALRLEHLFQTTDGLWYLLHPRSKTKKSAKKAAAFLSPVAMDILQKYSDFAQRTGKLLPVHSDQDANRKLKAIASMSGFSRFPLTWYVARRTNATYLLNNGASFETVAAHLGNTPEMVRRFYAQKKNETVVREVAGIYSRNKAV